MPPSPADKPHIPSRKARASSARLAAVQLLYSAEISGGLDEDAITAFLAQHRGLKSEGLDLVPVDEGLYRRIVRGTRDSRVEVDAIIDGSLAEGRDPSRLELLLRSILRAGVYELMAHGETPAPIIIAEYLHVAEAFYEGREPALVNGILDRAARELREG